MDALGHFTIRKMVAEFIAVRIFVIELPTPTRSGYTHGLKSEAGDTIGWFYPDAKRDGFYRFRGRGTGSNSEDSLVRKSLGIGRKAFLLSDVVAKLAEPQQQPQPGHEQKVGRTT